MRKDIFIDEYEQSDVVKDRKNFLQKIKELRPYIVEFKENNTMKLIVYLLESAVERNNWLLATIITHDKYKFSANNRV